MRHLKDTLLPSLCIPKFDITVYPGDIIIVGHSGSKREHKIKGIYSCGGAECLPDWCQIRTYLETNSTYNRPCLNRNLDYLEIVERADKTINKVVIV